ncbi:MAG TPA: alpha/beta fold hydrolase, partial [Cyclobacteriaceae bacterium]|nr:alpha/beta fold hydrolase [Cyclobacteriaceae bacterium]
MNRCFLEISMPVSIQSVFIILSLAGSLFVSGCSSRKINMQEGKFPEEMVYTMSEDGVPNAGMIFNVSPDSAGTTVVIWVHGWGVNFYYPTYVNIGRSLAEQGYACINVNTRMHDIGFNIGETKTMRIRGGGYWGKPSEEVLDLAAWVDFAEKKGFKHVVLVGHSAGWEAVCRYQAEKQDPRIAGIVLASGSVTANTDPPDPELLEGATRLVAEGHGDDLLRIPNRRFPSFISAATFLDMAETRIEYKDFFGIRTPNPGISRIRCPILAWYGTGDDVGNESDLDLLKSCIRKLS